MVEKCYIGLGILIFKFRFGFRIYKSNYSCVILQLQESIGGPNLSSFLEIILNNIREGFYFYLFIFLTKTLVLHLGVPGQFY